MPGMQAIDASNEELFHKLESLREKPSFRFFSVDILASCEYMPQELFECYTESCEIYPAEEEEVRETWGYPCFATSTRSLSFSLCRSLHAYERLIVRSMRLI
jgi:hypothetical protein